MRKIKERQNEKGSRNQVVWGESRSCCLGEPCRAAAQLAIPARCRGRDHLVVVVDLFSRSLRRLASLHFFDTGFEYICCCGWRMGPHRVTSRSSSLTDLRGVADFEA